MLQNKYLNAKIGVDTAENEPPKVSDPYMQHLLPVIISALLSAFCNRTKRVLSLVRPGVQRAQNWEANDRKFLLLHLLLLLLRCVLDGYVLLLLEVFPA